MFRIYFFLILISFLILSCGGKNKPVLYIFNWTDYIADELIKQFEEKHNCKIVYDTYNSNENMLTKLLTTKSSYDLVVPSGDHVVIMIQKGLLEPINKSKLHNYKYLDPLVLEKARSFDPENRYSIPYFWGATGLVYNKKYIPQEVIKEKSWNIIANPFFAGKKKVTMLDDAREVIGAALIAAGLSPNDYSDIALRTAEAILVNWDKNISQYDSDSYKNETQDGTTWLAQAYNGDALQIMAENEDIGFFLPKEGASLWIDSMVIPKYSEHKELAYQFIDFMLDPQNGKVNTEYVQYATPNQASMKLLSDKIKNNKLIYPDASYLAKCTMITNIGENILKLDQIWQKIRK